MANPSTITNSCSSASLQYAKTLIKTPPIIRNEKNKKERKYYEHYVASWGCTISNLVFTGQEWISTPERRDDYSGRKPDWSVYKMFTTKDNKQGAKPHVLTEYKSVKGDRFEKALDQTVDDYAETMDAAGQQSGVYDVFIVIIKGTKIGFFEYHNDTDLDVYGIPNFKSCTYLTQDYEINGIMTCVLDSKPDGMEPLYYNTNRLKKGKLKNNKQQKIRDEAARYKELCVLDMDKHQDQINFLYHHMLNNEPISYSGDEISVTFSGMHLGNSNICSYYSEEQYYSSEEEDEE